MRSRHIATLAVVLCLAVLPLAGQAQEDGYADSQPQGRQTLDRIVAVVNDGAIMHSELEARVAQTRSQIARQQQEVPSDRVLREQILDRMIVEEIQLQLAREANLSVDDTELNGQVRSIAENNGMTLDQFADALEADGLSLSVVRDQVRRELMMRQLQQRQVASRVNISEREVDRFVEQEGATREQARQALFQRKVNAEMEEWIQEIRSRAFVDNRLADR
ncbi:SurA N-terminal domain-containing protein [Halomonas daqiaonensis]|uniref:Peptidyl-prolyl cis-trans isomerase SurA n=1 Tax=Halomonas daqiaonensis TaxID=650850 RepID=A0A1H7N8E4_9GAMM|nr:SurA N-terminal domain-containing protein [Halomonas daqiaonensis]SEL19238.1 peptidyl-prolyl cis-trans isomerase SurA [Halomonas daqiaonensis]